MTTAIEQLYQIVHQQKTLPVRKPSPTEQLRKALVQGRSLYFIWSLKRPGLQLILEDEGKAADITPRVADALEMSELILDGRLLSTPMQLIWALNDVIPAFPQMTIDCQEQPYYKKAMDALERAKVVAH